MKRTLTLSFLFLLICVMSFAQHNQQHYAGADATQFYKGASEVYVNNNRNTISFIRLRDDQTITTSNAINWLKSDVLKASSADDLKIYHQSKDKAGNTHYRYMQYYHGLPVEYGAYNIHARSEKVRSANGEWYQVKNVNTTPSITAADAYLKACNYVAAKTWWHEREDADNNELMILPSNGQFKLVYKCDVYSKEPLTRQWVYVDAHDGSVIKTENRIHNTDVPGAAITAYNGTQTIISDSFALNQFRLREYTRGAGVETYNGSEPNDFVNGSKDWDLGGSFDIYALDAHFGAEAVYDFYDQNFDWQSVDGNGTQKLKSLVHTGGGINAFWDGTYMSYLDGDNTNGNHPLTSLDVCGHELTHGVTEHSSGLIYAGESGGLNESFSDIAGITMRFLAYAGATWVLGDQFFFPIRDMEHPNLYECPDTYHGDFWNNLGSDVHITSGVQNFWYVLMVDGGSGVNDNGDTYDITGLGLTDAYNIAISNDMFYLTSNATYDDAREMSIQAAIDLFGDCSNQVIQTANAWYAVGVGDPYENSISSMFYTQQTSFCSAPATVSFTNQSFNATSYVWDFGDGNTSTDASSVVTHTYDLPGTYTVSLIANGAASCGNSDTLVYTAYINVDTIGSTTPASCITTTTGNPGDFGIYRVKFNTIDNYTPNDDGYQDYTCSDFTYLIAGDNYTLTVWTNPELFSGGNEEDVRVWLDYNNDGVFDDINELVYSDDDGANDHVGTISTPVTAPLNTPIRMRVTDDDNNQNISGSCYNPSKGQTEDYAVVFLENTSAPVADFVGNPLSLNLGASVDFTDLSVFVPTSWQWSFPGGSPSTSSVKNPTGIVYSDPGSYDVTLIASNDFGSDTITKVAYIKVNAAFNMCTIDSTAFMAGTFYDTGGSAEKYLDNENCTLLIQPPCAGSITLFFSQFASESGADVMNIYDGVDASAPLLTTLTGTPNVPISITGTSGAIFITWVTDADGTKAGYTANWTSTEGGLVVPVADFNVSNSSLYYGETVSFTDLTTNLPIHWHWDFGDGNTSIEKNPTHTFTTSGTLSVTLIASNCGGADTITKTITVQQPPVMIVSPTNLDVNFSCGQSSFTFPVVVQNHGAGDLVYDVREWEYAFQGTQPNILALTYGIDLQNYPNTIDAIDQYFTNYTLTTTETTDGDELAAQLQGKNVFLMTKPGGDEAVYLNYATALQNFVNSGGTVIICGTASGQKNCIFNTGLLEGDYGDNGTNDPLDVVNLTHPITEGLPATIARGPKKTLAYNFSGIDVEPLIKLAGFTVTGISKQGYGNVVYLGFDYQDPNDTASRVIGNTLGMVNDNLVADWVTITPTGGGVLGSGGEQEYTVTVTDPGLPSGNYTEYFVVYGNDPNNPIDTIWLNVSVSTEPCVSFIYSNECDGNYCFTDSVLNGATSVHYDFGDGSSSDEQDPCHAYTSSGTYTVTLIGCGSFGCDTITSELNVALLAAQITTAGAYYEGNPIDFFSNGENAVSYSWDFDDGFTSPQENPQHTYADPGTYTVTLTVTDASGCTYTTTLEVVVLPVGIGGAGAQFDVSLYPNPANEQSYLQYSLPNSMTIQIELWNAAGQKLAELVSNQQQVAGNYVVPIRMETAGSYFVKMTADGKPMWLKLENVK